MCCGTCGKNLVHVEFISRKDWVSSICFDCAREEVIEKVKLNTCHVEITEGVDISA